MKKLVPTLILLVMFAVGATVYAQARVPVSTLPFSPARQAGQTLYVSGQIGVTEDGTPVQGTVTDETRQAMDNLGRVLKENGYDFSDIVSVTVYLADMKDYAEMNDAYRAYFPEENFPARACVGGLQIAFGLHTEISCIAYKE